MEQRNKMRIVAPVIGAVVLLSGGVGLAAQAVAAEGGVAAAQARGVQDSRAVTAWVERNADRLRTVDPAAPLDDMEFLRGSVGDAAIVGLGEPAHRISEVTALKHRSVRYLVERMGFRSVAWEGDWTVGLEVDAYVRTGKGDVTALLNRMSPAWQTRETADLLNWMRDYNEGRRPADQVGFFGTEYYTTWLPAYEMVDRYVARVAPGRLPELRKYMKDIRPKKPDAFAHATWYRTEVKDKKPYIADARRVYELVDGLHHGGQSLALHSARQILWFYEHYDLPWDQAYISRDARAAENLRWWRSYSRDKVVYWAASAHSAVAPDLKVTVPPGPDVAWPSVGSYLHRWYGSGYRSIGFTFDHGTVGTDADGTVTAPPPAADWFERPIGQAKGFRQFAIDLRNPAPAPVREWLRAPVKTRGVTDAESPHDSFMSGGTLGQWFDVIVHRHEVTAARPL
ncbi:erythromycin esterase family protein [Actinomadura rugatobispora]|uniref:Erythromycin esterase family protein n=1 Tax=Actinomadura rugatobispora TaxID=1994 RepID=A0ABW1A0M6_9ACTN|nr:erythromycin esterase family protein [Actinomadura rugatobispora]